MLSKNLEKSRKLVYGSRELVESITLRESDQDKKLGYNGDKKHNRNVGGVVPPTINDLILSFFNMESIDEINVMTSQNISNFELRILWKTLNVFLVVTVETSGKVSFEFVLPNKLG
jgi:hypothetical protein